MDLKKILLSLGISCAAICGASATDSGDAGRLVILHTNDTHSQIDPLTTGRRLGGIMRRKALIDSIRAAEPNVLVVDAGDAVQGSLFFYLHGGTVEQELLNALGTDIRILGNHEFDNGVDSLARVLALSDAEKLATNYYLEESALAGQFKPYTIREVGGQRIGFMGLNLRPQGMIAEGNYDGVVFSDPIESANLTARFLREVMHADAVVALSHMGYNPEQPPGDSLLAVSSRGIDLIIGGHSHDIIDPNTTGGIRRSRLKNADGDNILVVQTGKSGAYLGQISIPLDDRVDSPAEYEYSLIPVDNRLDGYNDPVVAEIIDRYRPAVDSIMALRVGYAPHDLHASAPEILNYMSDFVYERGRKMASNVDFAIVNKGGIRIDLPAGDVSKGQILTLIPFNNRIQVIDIKGRDLRGAFDAMARTEGNGISRQVRATYDPATQKAVRVTVNGKPLEDDRTYRIATIDYLVGGGDYMSTLRNSFNVASSDKVLYDELLDHLRDHPTIRSSDKPRMTPTTAGK